MNKQLYLVILLLTCKICNSQNLVPNGDFEQYISCPTAFSQLDSALYWFNPTNATPDYFNQCATSTNAGVPYNFGGYQPARSGVAYAGLHRYSLGFQEYREYIEIQLLSPLVANSSYHLSMYINLSNVARWTTYRIGAYFSDTLISDTTISLLPFVPQINNTSGNVPDTLNWTLVGGNYTATGGENYLIIGNFNDNTTTPITVVDSNSTFTHAYVYIDDVSLTQLKIGIEEQNKNSAVNIYPNPAIDYFNVRVNNNEHSNIIVYDIASRKIIEQSFVNSTSINTHLLAKGIYFYEVRNKYGVVQNGKITKE